MTTYWVRTRAGAECWRWPENCLVDLCGAVSLLSILSYCAPAPIPSSWKYNLSSFVRHSNSNVASLTGNHYIFVSINQHCRYSHEPSYYQNTYFKWISRFSKELSWLCLGFPGKVWLHWQYKHSVLWVLVPASRSIKMLETRKPISCLSTRSENTTGETQDTLSMICWISCCPLNV